jgi:hypothetical protein
MRAASRPGGCDYSTPRRPCTPYAKSLRHGAQIAVLPCKSLISFDFSLPILSSF